jgi:hypothetical protein
MRIMFVGLSLPNFEHDRLWRQIRIDYRWVGGDAARAKANAAQLVSLKTGRDCRQQHALAGGDSERHQHDTDRVRCGRRGDARITLPRVDFSMPFASLVSSSAHVRCALADVAPDERRNPIRAQPLHCSRQADNDVCLLALSTPALASEIDCNGYRYGMKVRNLVTLDNQ